MFKILVLITAFALGMGTFATFVDHQQSKDAKKPLAAIGVFACDQYEGTIIITHDGTEVPLDVKTVTADQAVKLIDPLFKSGHVGMVNPCLMSAEPIPHDFPGEPGSDKTTT